MAEFSVAGLFGISPELIQTQLAKENEARAMNLANLAPAGYGGITYGATKFGQNLGSAVQGLLGIEDPQLKKAKDIEFILQSTQQELGADGISDPTKLYPTLSQKLADAGYGNEAAQVAVSGQKEINDWVKTQATAKKDLALAAKAERENDPKEKAFWGLVQSGKVSPASVKAAINNDMDFSLLDINDREKKSAFAQQLLDAGYKEGSKEWKDKMNEFIESEISGKKKGTGNVMIGAIGIDTGAAGKEAGKVIGEATALIENKYSALDSIKEAKTVLSQGINAGIYGPTQQFITKATGGLVGSKEKVINTEQFLSYIGNTVIPRLQEFGGNDSVEELKYLQNVMGGNQTLEPESTKRILESAERKIKLGIERLERQNKSAGTKEGLPLDKGPSRTAEEAAAPTIKRRKYIPGQGFVEAQ